MNPINYSNIDPVSREINFLDDQIKAEFAILDSAIAALKHSSSKEARNKVINTYAKIEQLGEKLNQLNAKKESLLERLNFFPFQPLEKYPDSNATLETTIPLTRQPTQKSSKRFIASTPQQLPRPPAPTKPESSASIKPETPASAQPKSPAKKPETDKVAPKSILKTPVKQISHPSLFATSSMEQMQIATSLFNSNQIPPNFGLLIQRDNHIHFFLKTEQQDSHGMRFPKVISFDFSQKGDKFIYNHSEFTLDELVTWAAEKAKLFPANEMEQLQQFFYPALEMTEQRPSPTDSITKLLKAHPKGTLLGITPSGFLHIYGTQFHTGKQINTMMSFVPHDSSRDSSGSDDSSTESTKGFWKSPFPLGSKDSFTLSADDGSIQTFVKVCKKQFNLLKKNPSGEITVELTQNIRSPIQRGQTALDLLKSPPSPDNSPLFGAITAKPESKDESKKEKT